MGEGLRWLSFLEIDLNDEQYTTRDVLRRLKGWTDEQMGPKIFHGPVVTDRPLDKRHLCSVVQHALSGTVSAANVGFSWRVVRPETELPGGSYRFFQLGQQWTHESAYVGERPQRGNVYFEFVAEYGGLNRDDWVGRWLFPSGTVPTDWSVSYLTVTLADSAGWGFPPAEMAACRSVRLVDAALMAVFGLDATPLIFHEGSPWMLGTCTRQLPG